MHLRPSTPTRTGNLGKSKAKVASKDTPQTTFNDVAGAEEAIEELQEIREFLSEPAKIGRAHV